MGKRGGQSRIIFVNRFFHPDHSATAQILSDVAEALARTRSDVQVITSRLSYDGGDGVFARREAWNNVDIVRIATTRFGRGNLLGRALDYLSFYISAVFSLLYRVRRGDLVVIKTDPPLLSIPLGLAVRLKAGRQINWLQDIYPDVAEKLGVGFAGGPLGRILKWLRNRSFRRADMNVVIGERMREYLLAHDVPSEKIAVIHNFVDDVSITPLADAPNPVREAWGFTGNDFIIGYSGNLGRAHDIETVLAAAGHLSDHTHIKFLFVGGGHLRENLQKQAEQRGLNNLVLKPYQPRDQLRYSLAVADLHWVSLLPELEGLIVPSKLYGIAAAGRPVLMIGDPDGEIGRLAERHDFGTAIRPSEHEVLADYVLELSRDPARLTAMGGSARSFLDVAATRQAAFDAWSELLESLHRGQAT